MICLSSKIKVKCPHRKSAEFFYCRHSKWNEKDKVIPTVHLGKPNPPRPHHLLLGSQCLLNGHSWSIGWPNPPSPSGFVEIPHILVHQSQIIHHSKYLIQHSKNNNKERENVWAWHKITWLPLLFLCIYSYAICHFGLGWMPRSEKPPLSAAVHLDLNALFLPNEQIRGPIFWTIA